ncbi:MAG: hypothetical protein ACRDNI_06905 [Gaiellaceae bacterium]
MSGPHELEPQQAADQAQSAPPGHFLSVELESDCARFLEDVRNLVRRREQEAIRVSPRL